MTQEQATAIHGNAPPPLAAPAGVQVPPSFVRRLLTIMGVVATAITLFLIIWYGASVLMLVFLSILLAVFWHGLAEIVHRRTGLAQGWSLAVVLLGLMLLFGGAIALMAPKIADQADELTKSLPRSIQSLRQGLSRYEWGRQIVGEMPNSPQQLAEQTHVATEAPRLLSSVLGAVGSFALMLFVALYLAARPAHYIDGAVLLVPPSRRDRFREVLHACGHTLWNWTMGTLVSMLSAGVLTFLGLWLLDIPLALVLGIIAAFGEFVPNIGPIIAGLPAVLFGLLESPRRALYVAGMLTGIQLFQSYLIQPLVQKRAVHLAPALMISVQVLMGVLLGPMGLLVATPLLAIVQVAVRMLYVEDVLGERPLPAPEPGA